MRSPEQKLHARIRNFNTDKVRREAWGKITKWTDWYAKPHVDGEFATVFMIFTLKGHEPSANTLKYHSVKVYAPANAVSPEKQELLSRAYDEFVRTFPYKLTDITPFGGTVNAPEKRSHPLPDYLL